MKSPNAVLFGFATLLGALSIWRSAALFEAPQPSAAPPAAAVANVTNAKPERPALGSWRRPLFREITSKENPAAAAAITGTVSGAKSPKLVGVVIDGDRRIAVIAYGGTLLRVVDNDKVGSWTVVHVDPHSTLLERAQATFRLFLDPVSDHHSAVVCAKDSKKPCRGT